jgi:protein-S-isoprenylcysteine O-methyltransferase Ste14
VTGAVVLLFAIWALVYLGWFFGRVHEAQIEARRDEQLRDAYEWAVRHGLLRQDQP